MNMQDKGYEVRNKFTVAEFFCGCGGFSRGFSRSGLFDVVLGVDIKKAALKTFRANHRGNLGEPETINQDIRTLSAESIKQILYAKNIDNLDVLIGGPPCQGFSQMRRSQERSANGITTFGGYNQLNHDPRNDLVLRFLELAHELQPKCIVIENVPQMRTHQFDGISGGLSQHIVSILEEMGYKVTPPKVINAADYGVPQLRERVFFLASRIGLIDFPSPTHINPRMLNSENCDLSPWVTVHDALADLPTPPLGNDLLGGGDVGLYGTASLYGQQMQSHQCFPYNHLTRSYTESVLRIIQHMQPGETWDSASERMKSVYSTIFESERKRDEGDETTLSRLDQNKMIVKAFYKRYYWSAYTRLDWQKPALTITANANFLGSGRFTHPIANRGITMREAARLQSFDDDFCFFTSDKDNEIDTSNISIGMDMIGEAVPPLLSESIAKQLGNALIEEKKFNDVSAIH